MKTKTMKTQDLTLIAKALIKESAYSITEIVADYKGGKSEGWRRGFFSARGFNWLQRQLIEKGLSLSY